MPATMELKKVIYAEEYHERIPLIIANSQFGVVHSIFNNGFNIKIDNKLYFIGTTKNGTLPFGIHLQHHALMKLLENLTLQESVSWEKDTQQIRFLNSHYSIRLQDAMRTNLSLRATGQDCSGLYKNLATFVSVLIDSAETTGLEISAEAFILHHLEAMPCKSRTEQELQSLVNVVFSNKSAEIEKVLRFLIGRGKGLTPSGDDHLVGLLAIAHATNRFSDVFLQVVKDLVCNERLTTDVGREYLKYALKGQFSSTVLDVVEQLMNTNQQLLNTKMLRLMEMGHSSGVDTLFGMLMGLLAIRRK